MLCMTEQDLPDATWLKRFQKKKLPSIKVVIPLETCVTVPVLANFRETATCLYIEKVFNSNRNLEDIYAAPDSLISKENPILQVSNFSTTAVTIQVRQILGRARNPDNWLDQPNKHSKDAL